VADVGQVGVQDQKQISLRHEDSFVGVRGQGSGVREER
jgi:hypothetical protein